jgi:hypothetical protein
MAQVRVGFMGALLRGGDPRRAWETFRAMAAADPAQVRRLAETDGGRALLDDSRSAWRARGYEAPFEFVFRQRTAGPGRGEGDGLRS